MGGGEGGGAEACYLGQRGQGSGFVDRREAGCDRGQTTLLLDADLDQAPGRGGGVREVHVCCLWEAEETGWAALGILIVDDGPVSLSAPPPVQSSPGPRRFGQLASALLCHTHAHTLTRTQQSCYPRKTHRTGAGFFSLLCLTTVCTCCPFRHLLVCCYFLPRRQQQ